MSGKKKQKKKKQATSRRTPKQTVQKPKNNRQPTKQTLKTSSKQEPKQTSEANNKTNSKQEPKQTSEANNKTNSKQGPKQAKIEIIKPSNKAQPRNEFRTHKKSGHPTYIFRKDKRYFDFIGLTHAEETKGEKNIALSKNPNPEDESTSYLRPNPKRDKATHFDNEIKKGWKFANEDNDKVNSVKVKPIKKEE